MLCNVNTGLYQLKPIPVSRVSYIICVSVVIKEIDAGFAAAAICSWVVVKERATVEYWSTIRGVWGMLHTSGIRNK